MFEFLIDYGTPPLIILCVYKLLKYTCMVLSEFLLKCLYTIHLKIKNNFRYLSNNKNTEVLAEKSNLTKTIKEDFIEMHNSDTTSILVAIIIFICLYYEKYIRFTLFYIQSIWLFLGVLVLFITHKLFGEYALALSSSEKTNGFNSDELNKPVVNVIAISSVGIGSYSAWKLISDFSGGSASSYYGTQLLSTWLITGLVFYVMVTIASIEKFARTISNTLTILFFTAIIHMIFIEENKNFLTFISYHLDASKSNAAGMCKCETNFQNIAVFNGYTDKKFVNHGNNTAYAYWTKEGVLKREAFSYAIDLNMKCLTSIDFGGQ